MLKIIINISVFPLKNPRINTDVCAFSCEDEDVMFDMLLLTLFF